MSEMNPNMQPPVAPQQFMNPAYFDPDRPKNGLLGALLVTVFCFAPLGFVALYYASKVDDLWLRGDREGAAAAAGSVKKFTYASIAAGVFMIVLILAMWGAIMSWLLGSIFY